MWLNITIRVSRWRWKIAVLNKLSIGRIARSTRTKCNRNVRNRLRKRNICTLTEILPTNQVYSPFILSFRQRTIRHLRFADLFVFASSPFVTGECESEATFFPLGQKNEPKHLLAPDACYVRNCQQVLMKLVSKRIWNFFV